MYRQGVKRILDILMAAVLLIPAGFLMILSGIAIKLEAGGAIFFVQQRPGLDAKPFNLYKLRTMYPETHRDGKLLQDKERITKTGRVIRALSIDELPQLINILKGDMSFIGPRPLLMKYVPLYNKMQLRRHEVRPGISGWAQVNGRNALSWEKKFELDVWYVDNVGFFLDTRIFFMTIANVLKRQGINANEEITMQEFTGNATR